MKTLHAGLLGLALGVGCTAAMEGQSFSPKSISFEGAPDYTQEELLKATQLAVGKAVTQADLDAVTQRLGDSGVFSDVNYQTAASGALVFTLKPLPADQMRAVEYGNFVMFRPEEIEPKVEQRVPLFRGRVPLSSPMQQSVERALDLMLKELGISATVTSIATSGGKLDLAISRPGVRVGSVEVTGADFGGMKALTEVRDRVVGTEYTEEFSGDGLRSNLLDAYRDMGYLDAAVSSMGHGPVQIGPDEITVSLLAKADAGSIYKVAKLGIPGVVPGVSADEIAGATQLKVGDPASRVRVLSTSARLTSVYSGHGYLDAKTTIEPVKDGLAHTMVYAFHEEPGEIYRMRGLGVRGLSEQQASAARGAWKLAPGMPFEQAALTTFETKGAGSTMCEGKPVEVKLAPERSSHLVDVILSCAGSYSSANR